MEPSRAPPSRPSTNLRDEVEKLSSFFSGFCPQDLHRPPAANTHVETPDSNEDHSPEPNLKPSSKPENTVLLNQTMEMTLADAAEIVTVEGKVKVKGKKSKHQSCGSGEGQDPVQNLAQSQRSRVGKPDTDDPTLKVLHSPRSQSPKVLSPQKPKKDKKRSKSKLKSHQSKREPELCDVISPSLDSGPSSSKSCDRGTSVKRDGAEEVKSNITCRRSKAKGDRASVSRRTFVLGPFLLGEPKTQTQEEKDYATNPDLWVNGLQCRRQTFIIRDNSSPTAAPPAGGLTDRVTRTDPGSGRGTSGSSSQRQQLQEDHGPGEPPVLLSTKKPSRQERRHLGQEAAENQNQGRCPGNGDSSRSDEAHLLVDDIDEANKENLSGSGAEAGGAGQSWMELDQSQPPRSLRSNFIIYQQDQELEQPGDQRLSTPTDAASPPSTPSRETRTDASEAAPGGCGLAVGVGLPG